LQYLLQTFLLFKNEKIFLYLFFDCETRETLTIDRQSGSIYEYIFAHRGNFALFWLKTLKI